MRVAVRYTAVGDFAEAERLFAPMRAAATPLMDTVGCCRMRRSARCTPTRWIRCRSTKVRRRCRSCRRRPWRRCWRSQAPRLGSPQVIVELRLLGSAGTSGPAPERVLPARRGVLVGDHRRADARTPPAWWSSTRRRWRRPSPPGRRVGRCRTSRRPTTRPARRGSTPRTRCIGWLRSRTVPGCWLRARSSDRDWAHCHSRGSGLTSPRERAGLPTNAPRKAVPNRTHSRLWDVLNRRFGPPGAGG